MDFAEAYQIDAPGAARPDLCPAHFRARGEAGEAGQLATWPEAERATGTAPRPAPAPQRVEACPVEYASDMQELPAALRQDDVTTVEKLVYLWLRQNPGEWSDRTLTAALDVRTHNALKTLTARGLLIEEEAPSGRRAGTYRAAPQPRGPRPRPSVEGETE